MIFDCHMSMSPQISQVCKTASYMYYLRRIGLMRRYLSQEVLVLLVTALVFSRLDYCNSLLVNTPANQLSRLQRMQNAAARLVSGTGRREHITPVLARLHWLPVKQRITFKICCTVYKALHDQAPRYLSELLALHAPARPLRSGDSGSLLAVPRVRTSRGDRAFMVAAPQLWNSLPETLRGARTLSMFRRGLKTHLYEQA